MSRYLYLKKLKLKGVRESLSLVYCENLKSLNQWCEIQTGTGHISFEEFQPDEIVTLFLPPNYMIQPLDENVI